MNPVVVFSFVTIAVLFTVSPVSAHVESYNLEGLWHVVAQDEKSPLKWTCWTAQITKDDGFFGEGYTNFTNGEGKTISETFKFWNHLALRNDNATPFDVMRQNKAVSEGYMFLRYLDSNTVVLSNIYNSRSLKKLLFRQIYAQRDTSIPLPSDISAKKIASCEEYEGNVY